MGKRGKAIFLTALVLYASSNSITLNKNESLNIALNNKPVTNTTQEQQERKQPREVMYLFEEQNIIPHKLQETPKIKKKKK